MTLREISIVMAGAAKRIERERQFSEFNAWLGARLMTTGYHQPKKFPEFRKISASRIKRKRQSWAEQKAFVQVLNAAFNGVVRQNG